MTAFNKLKIMSEVVLLPNTDDCLQQVEDYVEVVLLPNTDDCLQQVEDYVRGCSTTKY
jgi:ribosomal protein L30/L7E